MIRTAMIAAAALAVLTAAAPAEARRGVNGPEMNGIACNGNLFNGVEMKGHHFQGVTTGAAETAGAASFSSVTFADGTTLSAAQ